MDISFPVPGKQTARPSQHEGIHHGVSWLLGWLVGSLES
jgi:hypothetical protein